jgi:hypothetical protein
VTRQEQETAWLEANLSATVAARFDFAELHRLIHALAAAIAAGRLSREAALQEILVRSG